MTRIVSVIPKPNDRGLVAHIVDGTKILLDDGTYLQGVTKVTLVAEVGCVWKAIIEVHPINQPQIDALLESLEVLPLPAGTDGTL